MQIEIAGQFSYVYTGNQPLILTPTTRTVVFLHGAAMDHTVWLWQSRYFAHHGYNVLAVDFPGHGRSSGRPLSNIAALADWILALLDSLRIDQVLLVGHSMGALVTLDIAARAPGRVSALALLGIALPMAVGPALLAAAQVNSPAAIDMITIWGLSNSAHLGASEVPGLWMVGSVKRLLERAKRDVLYTDLAACNDYTDGLDRATQVVCPTLLLVGQKDLMTPPRGSRELIGLLDTAAIRTVVLAHCGHMMTIEQPGQTLDALLEWVNSIH